MPRRTGRVALAVVLALGGLVTPAAAQQVVGTTEELDFDRPESWGMKFYASLSLLTGLGVPETRRAGAVEIGFEGSTVPQLSDEERRLGFGGTKLEDVNKTSFFGRLRGAVGLPASLVLEAGYTPPVLVGGAKPHLFAVGLARPITLSPSWRLAVRGYAQLGSIEADITCSAEEAAAGDDPVQNPFGCEAPSEDELKQMVLGLETVVSWSPSPRWRPHLGVAVNYMDLEFQVNARYSGIVDQNLQLTDGTTVAFTGGLTWLPSDRWRVSGELLYSPLSIQRPPATEASDEGFFNGRLYVAYRF